MCARGDHSSEAALHKRRGMQETLLQGTILQKGGRGVLGAIRETFARDDPAKGAGKTIALASVALASARNNS